jgi:hypothetical protein
MAMQPRPPGYQSEMPGNTLRVLIPLLVPIRHGSELLTEVELTEPDLGARRFTRSARAPTCHHR